MIHHMVIALVLLAAWVVLNVSLLGAVAFANHRGQRAAVATVPAPAPRRATAVAVAA